MKIQHLSLSAILALALPCAAQEERLIGVQLRMGIPVDNVAEATGRKVAPGASIHVEMDIEDGYRWRMGGGADRWGYGAWDGRPGVSGQVAAVFFEVEGLKFLRPDLDAVRLGPYVMFGVRTVLWTIADQSAVLDLRTSRRTTHLAASFGMGYRVAPWLDLELKGWYGHADPQFKGGAYALGATVRF